MPRGSCALVIEGTWLDMMTADTPYSSEDGRQTVSTALALCFPRHFEGPTNPLRR